MCERCWGDAFIRKMLHGGSQVENYKILVADREREDPCSPQDQAGQFWDKEKQRDRRKGKA